MHWLNYDKKNSNDFGVFLTNSGIYDKPSRKYETVSVPGKNGDLIIEYDKYDNVDVKYPCVIYDNFSRNYEAFTGYILSKKGYLRLEDTFEPERFRLANVKDITSVKVTSEGDAGSFVLIFDSKPQRYYKSGERSISLNEGSHVIWNPTNFDAKPLIRVKGNGELKIGSNTITVDENPLDYIDIDCDIMDCFSGATNANKYVLFSNYDSPVIHEGGVGIVVGTGLSVSLTPRWWTL